ncbi:unnamed protein product [Arabis nemorensis]|uniref:Endonuclease/exonuclease/phosphatase domain-containing protein n=1 Tax=Arabis nemorensis TaxID=586526 RepID=A0A565AN10_9BRAS|nr:unnamed protein product [Arabis nemorensis]
MKLTTTIIDLAAFNVTVLFKSPQMITVGIESVWGENFICSCIYASNFRNDRVTLWEEIRHIHTLYGHTNLPWIVLGDFNVILSSDEHSRVQYGLGNQAGMREFQELVADCELTDLGYTGPKLTWWNHQDDGPIGKCHY